MSRHLLDITDLSAEELQSLKVAGWQGSKV